jgi:hypothetical protein
MSIENIKEAIANIGDIKKMYIGDIVVPKNPKEGVILRCGSYVYTHAVCVSVDPFTLVSPEGDMTWYNLDHNDFISLSQVHPDILKQCKEKGYRIKQKKDWKIMKVQYVARQQTFYIGTNGKSFRIRASSIRPMDISIGFAEELAESMLELINHSKGKQNKNYYHYM